MRKAKPNDGGMME